MQNAECKMQNFIANILAQMNEKRKWKFDFYSTRGGKFFSTGDIYCPERF